MTQQILQTGESLQIKFAPPFSMDVYELFKNCKRLPESTLEYDYANDSYTIETHSRYANLLGIAETAVLNKKLELSSFLFDYQKAIVNLALDAKRYAVWANVGLGKTLIELEFARQVVVISGGRVLIITLNEIVPQTVEMCKEFYGESLPILQIDSQDALREWCKNGDGVHSIAITNYEKMNLEKGVDIMPELKFLSGIILDESSRLKAGGGRQKWAIIKSSKGIPYKLSATATPAPNDYIEFASQASFLERMRDENEIIWTFFQRDRQTQEWTVKRHAREAFFEWMCAWSIYLKSPQNFGWSSDYKLPPEPEIIQHELEATIEQTEQARLFNFDTKHQPSLFVTESQGIVGRSKMSQIAKGFVYLDGKKKIKRIDSVKPEFVANLIHEEVKRDLQVLVWTIFDEETEIISEILKDKYKYFQTLSGTTPKNKRPEILEEFRKGTIPVLISKAALLGYGMNFQMCGSMVFSGWNDSFESFYQAIGRAVRYGQQKRVRIHLPFIREFEYEQLENIFRKQGQFNAAILEQEKAYIKAMKGMKLL